MKKDKISWLADSVSVGLARMRYDGNGLKIEYANKGLYDILGYSGEEYANKFDNYFNVVVCPDDWDRMRQVIEKSIAEWAEFEVEYSVQDEDGRVGWRRLQAVPLWNENGTCFQCSVVGITKIKETEIELNSLLDYFPGCLVRVFYDGSSVKLEFISEGMQELVGYSREEYNKTFVDDAQLFYSEYYSVWGKDFLDAALLHDRGIRKEFHISKENFNRWIEVHSAVVSRSDKGVLIQYVLMDITERKEAEEHIKKERERLDVVAGLSVDSIFEYHISDDRMEYFNRKEGLMDMDLPVIENYTARILDGSFIGTLFHSEDRDKLIKLCQDFTEGKPEIYAEVRKLYKGEKFHWVSVEGKTICGPDGIPSHIIGRISNIDERVKREEELRIQSEMDSLTGLYNGPTAKRKIADKLAVLSLKDAYLLKSDIDDFKVLNDRMGHLFGDAVLCTFADSLTELFPDGIIGRIGGDEFILYIEGISTKELHERIEKINRLFARIHAGENDNARVSASFGFALCDKGKRNSLDKLEKHADTALLYLKKEGKGSILQYDGYMSGISVYKEAHSHDKPEAIIQTAGDLILFAHELFDNVKEIKGALRIIADSTTRFFHFQDILFVRRLDDKRMRMMFHWGEKDLKQFYDDTENYSEEKDWKRLLYTDESKEYVVLQEKDIIGINVNQAKSMLSFRIGDGDRGGYCICVDRRESRDWQEELSTLLRLGDFVIRRYVELQDKKQQEQEAEYRSKYDWITSLPNYTHFLEAGDRYIREHKEQKFVLIYTDFINFQFLNEVYGYSEGDKVLKEYGRVLCEDGGVMHARITADRFVSLYELTDAEENRKSFLHMAEVFCDTVNSRYDECKLGVVGGLAELDRSLDSFAHNVDNANVARKKAKEDMISQIVVYTPALRVELQKQMEIVARMADALAEGEFKLFLQPKVDMFTNQVIGAEALVRWFRPDGTMVSPGDFIPIFEKNGFVTQLDFEILRQVLCMQQERLMDGKPIVKVSVNFSRKHQENPNYIRQLDEMLERYKVPTKSLEIEITESVFMYDLAPLTESIRQLKQRGLSISIDDFGAGYSSLNVLSKVKADIVKLDRQFLLDVEMEKDNFSSEFLQMLINMIKQLGFKVLAEGVETEEQVNLLKEAGCRFAQGYYYARPMPVEQFLEFLDSHSLGEDL